MKNIVTKPICKAPRNSTLYLDVLSSQDWEKHGRHKSYSEYLSSVQRCQAKLEADGHYVTLVEFDEASFELFLAMENLPAPKTKDEHARLRASWAVWKCETPFETN